MESFRGQKSFCYFPTEHAEVFPWWAVLSLKTVVLTHLKQFLSLCWICQTVHTYGYKKRKKKNLKYQYWKHKLLIFPGPEKENLSVGDWSLRSCLILAFIKNAFLVPYPSFRPSSYSLLKPTYRIPIVYHICSYTNLKADCKTSLCRLKQWCFMHTTSHQWQDLTQGLCCHCVMAKFPVQAVLSSSSPAAQEISHAFTHIKK